MSAEAAQAVQLLQEDIQAHCGQKVCCFHQCSRDGPGHQNWEIVGPDSFTEAFLR